MTEAAGDELELTGAEHALMTAVLAGLRADLKGETIRAAVLRDLALETRPDRQVPPAGINVRNAVIDGIVDLEGCAVATPLVFLDCRFDAKGSQGGVLRLRDARLKRVALYNCRIKGAIKADRAHIESAFFMTGSILEGLVRLRGARIGEALAMDGTTIENARSTAILADGLRLDGPWVLRNATVSGQVSLQGARIGGGLLWEEARFGGHRVAIQADAAHGESVWVLRRAYIEGAVRFRGATLAAIDAPEIEVHTSTEGFNGRGAKIAGEVLLDGAKITGGLRLGRAHIRGELSAKGATLTGQDHDWALAAAGIEAAQGVSLASAKLKGGMTLAGAVIGQGLSASNIEIDGERGRAIEADVIHIRGNWIMRGASIQGSVRFAGARIEGQVGFTESKIRGSGDLAIRADGAHIAGGWFMGRAEISGLVRLPAARIGNEMRLRATKLEVDYGPGLFASGVRIARELVLDGGFRTCGGIVLDHAEIEGMLELSGSRIQSAALGRGGSPRRGNYDEVLESRYDEVAISLVDARLNRLVMPDRAADRPRGIVDLSRARVGSYEDGAGAWPPPLGKRAGDTRGLSADGREIDHLVLDGFVYDYLEHPSGLPAGAGDDAEAHSAERNAARMRIRWLESQSENDLKSHFKPQAWVQLARVLAAQGYQDDAREVAIARRRRHRRSASATRTAKLQGWFLDVFALYGFNPWRTVAWMLVAILAFSGLWMWGARQCARPDCKDETVFVMVLKGNYGQDDARAVLNYPAFTPLGYSFDVFMPFVSFGAEDHWRPNPDYGPLGQVPATTVAGLRTPAFAITVGGLLYGFYIVEVMVGLVLTSLAVTGFTGLLRGEEETR